MKHILLYSTLLAILFLSACSGSEKQQEDNSSENQEVVILSESELQFTSDQMDLAGIKTGEIRHRPFSRHLTATGYIMANPDNIVSITPYVGGVVKSLKVLPGKKVKKGEVLAVLQHQDYIELQMQYLQTSSELDYLEKEYERQKTLVESNASALKNLQKTEAEYKNKKASKTALSEQLKLLGIQPENLSEDNISNSIYITSPIEGYITKAEANVGKFVTPEEVMIEIVNNKNLHLELKIFEKDILKVSEGQGITFMVENNPEQFDAKVVLVGQSVDEQNRTVEIHGHFNETYEKLKHGMRVNAEINLVSDTLDMLPEQAVIKDGNDHYIFIETDANTFKRIPITVHFTEEGCSSVQNTYLVSGTEPLLVVIEGANYLQAELNKTQE